MKRRTFLAGLAALPIVGRMFGKLSAVQAAVHDNEHAAVLAIIPDSAITLSAVTDGEWDKPATWGGRLPADGDTVLIPAGKIVLLDHLCDARLKGVRVDGSLEFAPTEDTELCVDTLVVNEGGVLEIGSAVSPLTGTAKVTFIDTGALPTNSHRGLVSIGMVAIVGKKTGETRNIVFASESTTVGRRGHVMLMHHTDYVVENVELVNLGRTNKAIPIGQVNPDGTVNARGRYALHYHRLGNLGGEPVVCKGVIVRNSPGWGIASHSSHVIVEDSETYDVFGAGFVAEAGDEEGEFRRCKAFRSIGSRKQIESRQKIGDFGHGGHGFWSQSNKVGIVDCLSSGHGTSAFQYYGDSYKEADTGVAVPSTRKMSVRKFEHNVAFDTPLGFGFYNAQGPEPADCKDCKTEGCYRGVEVRKAFVDLVGGEYHGKLSPRGKPTGLGVEYVHGYNGRGNVRGAKFKNFEDGIKLPVNGTFTIEPVFENISRYRYVYGIGEDSSHHTIKDAGGSNFRFNIGGAGSATKFYEIEQSWTYNGKRVWTPFQTPSFVPPSDITPYPGLTNQQALDQHGKLPLGELVPAGAVNRGEYWIEP